MYPACSAHAPYCHLWPVWLNLIFLLCLTNGTIFEGGGGGVTKHIMRLMFFLCFFDRASQYKIISFTNFNAQFFIH